MSIRRSLPVFAALALAACTPAPTPAGSKQDAQHDAKPDAKPEPASAPEATAAEPSDEPDYASFGMPDPAAPWSIGDYSAAHKAVNAIAKQDRKLLPRAGSPSFAALTNLDHLDQLVDATAPEQVAGLTLSLGMIHMIYGDQIRRDPSFEREHLALTAAVLRVTTKLPATMFGTQADAAALRSEPARLKGLLQFRRGVYEMVMTMLEPAPNSTLAPNFACEQLALVIDDAAPLLLADERAEVRTKTQACTGAPAKDLERALADDAPTAALVTALLDEHQAHAAGQNSKP